MYLGPMSRSEMLTFTVSSSRRLNCADHWGPADKASSISPPSPSPTTTPTDAYSNCYASTFVQETFYKIKTRTRRFPHFRPGRRNQWAWRPQHTHNTYSVRERMHTARGNTHMVKDNTQEQPECGDKASVHKADAYVRVHALAASCADGRQIDTEIKEALPDQLRPNSRRFSKGIAVQSTSPLLLCHY